jgi:hypothetical protein
MAKPFAFLFKSAFVILFACSAVPVFAQHGGGGSHGRGGGGFHGGGSFHTGGGGRPRGGSSSPPATGYGAPRTAAPYAPRTGGGFTALPGNNYSRPSGNNAGGNQRVGNPSSAPPAVADGRWHSFNGASGSRGSSAARAEAAPSSNAGGFHAFSGNRGAGSTSTVRSFSGQGNEIRENSPAARNMVPKSQSLSSIHNSLSGSRAANSEFRSNSLLSPSSRFTGGSVLARNRGFSGGVNASNSLQQLRGSNRFGYRHGGFGGGCWNCGNGFGWWGNRWGWRNRWGWGFGGGWGFGWPWIGFWGWDPFIYDPWWGWPAPGYVYYSYPNNYLYGYPDSGYYVPDDNLNLPSQQDSQDNSNGNWVTPNGPNPSSAQNSASLDVPVLIYMKNGAVYSVRDYWIVDEELHYILMDGVQNSVALEQVDLPRTNTENAKSGVRFIFKSEPNIAPAMTAPAPTQELNAAPQHEART